MGLALGAGGALADAVRNGNEVALAFATNAATGKQAIQKQATGVIHTFRFLKVTAIERDQPEAGQITLATVEPSSDLKVTVVLAQPVSVEKVAALQLKEGDAVAVQGRIKSLGVEAPDTMRVEPAVLRHKDRAAPKLTKELLNEVDSSAHKGGVSP